MRWKLMLALLALCAMLSAICWTVMVQQTGRLEQECSILETEVMLLRFENAQLLVTLTELQNGPSGPGQCQVVEQK